MDPHNIVRTVLEFDCVSGTIYPNHTANDYAQNVYKFCYF